MSRAERTGRAGRDSAGRDGVRGPGTAAPAARDVGRNGRPLRVAVFAPFAKVTPHFETDLEIVQTHIDAGDTVTLLRCDADLPACAINHDHDLDVCVECMACRRRGERLLDGPFHSEPALRLLARDRVEMAGLRTEFDDLDELKAYRLEALDLGYAALSTMVSNLRDPAPDIREHADLLKRLIQATFTVYRSLQRYLDRVPTDRVYIFNGRFAVMRAAVRACESRGVDYVTHDRGRDHNHYALFHNALPVDPDYFQSRVRAAWEAADPGERRRAAERFYEERAQAIDRRWIAHASVQEQGRMPEGWDPAKRNVVGFTSSDDEVASIGDAWTNPVYPSQVEGFRRVVESLRRDPGDLHLWIRVHPNMRNVKDPEIEALAGILELDGGPVTVIPPESPVSSYALMEAAEKVLGFGTTVGIEAVYHGTPSILAGQAFYRELGGTYTPGTHEEVMRLLRSELEPKDPEGALMYGHYIATFGRPYRYFHGTGLYEGTFKGRRVEPGPLARVMMGALRRWRFRDRYLDRLLPGR